MCGSAPDPVAPWHGTPHPSRRAAISAQLLHEIESALRDTYRDAPIGSQVLPLPDSSPDDMAAMRAGDQGAARINPCDRGRGRRQRRRG